MSISRGAQRRCSVTLKWDSGDSGSVTVRDRAEMMMTGVACCVRVVEW